MRGKGLGLHLEGSGAGEKRKIWWGGLKVESQTHPKLGRETNFPDSLIIARKRGDKNESRVVGLSN